MSVGEGDMAPEFEMPATGGRTVSLAGLKGKPFVLYFYPKADTPGCTKEACAFQEALPQLGSIGLDVIGVSPDKMKPIEKFAEKFSLSFPLASDETKEVAERYGTWVEKSMYGRKYMGMERSTFLVDAEGQDRQGVAQGQRDRPCRGGAEGRPGPLADGGYNDGRDWPGHHESFEGEGWLADRVLEAFADLEADGLGLGDLDFLTGAGIAASGRLADCRTECAEADQADFIVLFHGVGDCVEHGVDDFTRLGARKIGGIGHSRDQVHLIHWQNPYCINLNGSRRPDAARVAHP